MGRRVSGRQDIRAVAAEAGVSVSTVSRAFNEPTRLNSETRRRVLEIASRLEYEPNRAARALITGRTGNLGLIVPDVANPFFPMLIKQVQAQARRRDHAVFIADTDERPAAEEELAASLSRQVDGLILVSSRLTEESLRQVAARTRTVLVNRSSPGVPSVLLDMTDGMRELFEHLHSLGHRRLAFLSGPRMSWSNQERRRLVRALGRQFGLEVVVLGPYEPTFAAGTAAAEAALESGVTAVLAYNDLMALGLLARLAELDVPVPGRLSVAGIDDIAMASIATPSLTTIVAPVDTAGRAAVDLLLDTLDHPDSAVAPFVRLATRLVPRRSSGPAATT